MAHNAGMIIIAVLLAGLGVLLITRAHPVRRILGGILLIAGIVMPWLGGQHAASAAPIGPNGINVQGVSFVPNDSLIAVETLSGQSMTLNAAATPVIFFTRQASSGVQQIQTALEAVHSVHRPVILVSTFFHHPRMATTATESFLKKAHITLPVVVQQGPPTLYVHSVPTMITRHDGRWVAYTGIKNILAHLSAVTTMPGTNSQSAKKKG